MDLWSSEFRHMISADFRGKLTHQQGPTRKIDSRSLTGGGPLMGILVTSAGSKIVACHFMGSFHPAWTRAWDDVSSSSTCFPKFQGCQIPEQFRGVSRGGASLHQISPGAAGPWDLFSSNGSTAPLSKPSMDPTIYSP
ncbi:hypothetical protein PABG_03890 [Paracoccidioides brasiliensis Pb03]|nr:hypothetical protein PABG_03890 [Paracoccidioides brasiliensis Pb03]